MCWFAPLQLLRTAQHVAIATVFGQNADARVIEALARPGPSGPGAKPPEPGLTASRRAGASALPAAVHDYSGSAAPFWFDYAADLGDGWDATYTVAYHLSQDRLPLWRTEERQGDPVASTERGSLLVFGGDEVYPTPSYEAYERRLVLPYSYALPSSGLPDGSEPGSPGEGEPLASPKPDVFAIPGNHDWYDSLVAFTRLFCSRQSFAGWSTPQERSYFALRLPAGWWLLGTDIQLGSEIDGPQRAFFQSIAERMDPADKVILCHSEPHWLYETIYPEPYRYRTVHELEASFGERVKVFLSGDCHFYTRHEGPGRVQKIIAGGGGAFLHLTCGPDDRRLTRTKPRPEPQSAWTSPRERESTGFEKRCAFPSWKTSARLCLTNPLFFHVRNPSFGLATAFGYVVTGEALIRPETSARTIPGLGDEIVARVFTDPFSLFWVVAVALGIVFFTETHSPWYRWTAGLTHAAAHLIAASCLAWQTAIVAQAWLGPHSFWQAPIVAAATGLAGYLVGPLLLAAYLTLSLLVFRRHRNDASSALRSPDYKNFLRFKIDAAGGLTIYPVGIRSTARRWATPGTEGGASRSKLIPADGTAPFLIESPIEWP